LIPISGLPECTNEGRKSGWNEYEDEDADAG